MYTAKSKSSKKEAALERELQSHFDFGAAVKEWLGKHETVCLSSDEWGLVELPVHWLLSPDIDMAARQKSFSHVDDIVISLQKFGIQVYNVKVLIWVEDVKKWAESMKELDFKRFDWSQPAPFKIQVIAGDHTIAALKKLCEMRPKNKLWKTMKVRLVVCENTKENRNMIRAVGSLDNKVAEVHKGATPWDNILQIHNVMASIQADNSLNATKKKEALSEYRTQCKTTMAGEGKGAERTIGNYFAIAKIKGKVWDNIAAIFKADAEGKLQQAGAKKGKSKTVGYGCFCHMAYLPDKDLIRWSQRVLDGIWTPTQFKNRCLEVKKVLKLHEYIVSYLNARHQNEFEKILDATVKYPFLLETDYMTSLIPAFNPKKKDNCLPQSIANSIDGKIKEMELQKQQAKEKEVMSEKIVRVFCSWFFFVYKKKPETTFIFFTSHPQYPHFITQWQYAGFDHIE